MLDRGENNGTSQHPLVICHIVHCGFEEGAVRPFSQAFGSSGDPLDELSDGGETAAPTGLERSGLHERQGR
jgi:hypothetical protein